jgi:hypothetical protein
MNVRITDVPLGSAFPFNEDIFNGRTIISIKRALLRMTDPTG